MLRFLCVVMCSFFTICSLEMIDKRIILQVRKSIEKSIHYIESKYTEVNEDCLLGVVLSTAFMMDSYRNGSHVLDSGTLTVIIKLIDVLRKSLPYVELDRLWIAESILKPNIWFKEVKYKNNNFQDVSNNTDVEIIGKIHKYENDSIFFSNMEHCLRSVTSTTRFLKPKKCFLNRNCRNIYLRSADTSGYILTHKLLILQVAKNRKCLMAKESHQREIKQLCSQIYLEVFNGDYFNVLDTMFDLFLEEVLLCGYEGYEEFLSNKWLLYILKSQRSSGCFPPTLADDLKTRIKKTSNIFEDGCADHTTGIGLAVLSLYYNFIAKELFI